MQKFMYFFFHLLPFFFCFVYNGSFVASQNRIYLFIVWKIIVVIIVVVKL